MCVFVWGFFLFVCFLFFAVQELGPSPVQCFPTTTCDLNEIATLFAARAMKISLAQPSAEMWQKRWCLSIRDCETENYLGDACIPKHTQKMCIASFGAGVPRRRLFLEARLKLLPSSLLMSTIWVQQQAKPASCTGACSCRENQETSATMKQHTAANCR